MALWGADAEAFRPERWAVGEDGAAAVRGNYGFLAFLVGFRYVYARVSISVGDWGGSSLGRTGRGRWLLRRGSLLNTGEMYSFPLKGWFGGEFFAYFVNIICYRGMKEGWKE